MPELPEVEVSRLGISPHVESQRVRAVRVWQPRLRWPIPDAVHLLQGEPIIQVRRRAKYLLLDSTHGSLILHLGMSGKLCVVPTQTPRLKHDHFELELETGKSMRLNDARRFGAVLWQPANETHALLANLGPEPLTEDFSADHLFQQSRGRSAPVKSFIMDNHVVVGVGNIYANEALFASGIDPRRAAGRISKARFQRLTQEIKSVLARAIVQGGTTLKDFMQADGKPGYFSLELSVYGRAGEPCVVCERPLLQKRIGQRNTFFCAHCQR
ncbi:bifunctional DNA-formamidopyrimidine glycosylase/DNA-(apurinic or apyrimidinic site) lyase [Aliidiomarina halalkaliphila]|uniref:Formamidopyrimidine-DNA glycosylase n=1 Tax=Aliidiomarina halalkaliphila TaxID=2593535 RepID=A0A552X292_9GAMM|nr:bifunctional DNA-formamidopyrimidine glycosylase/DNA-(apurinic or apyrimidinic site) lyase [Aliidiomarina halalkaliphila]TRW48989.1 bifunctional DNA-formamidopyrimidine glycosylase/DNA-(apurinic or apyrimidinic site) lyase [Aliidiomarina halalkaliphila]